MRIHTHIYFIYILDIRCQTDHAETRTIFGQKKTHTNFLIFLKISLVAMVKILNLLREKNLFERNEISLEQINNLICIWLYYQFISLK